MGARKMVKLKVEETSGVDHPAHLEEGWIVMKAAKDTAVAKQPKVEIELETEDQDMADTEEMDFEAMLAKMTEERDMYKQQLEELQKEMAPAEDDEEMMEKAMPEPVRALLTKARDEAAAARSELRKEVEARKDREFVSKAASWTALSINPDEIGPVLRKMADHDGDLAETIIKALASANAQAEAANIFAELGTGNRPDSSDAYGRMTKMAKAAVEAGEHKTIEQAIASLVMSNPELYEAYRQETRN
jgi:hypothetical protein